MSTFFAFARHYRRNNNTHGSGSSNTRLQRVFHSHDWFEISIRDSIRLRVVTATPTQHACGHYFAGRLLTHAAQDLLVSVRVRGRYGSVLLVVVSRSPSAPAQRQNVGFVNNFSTMEVCFRGYTDLNFSLCCQLVKMTSFKLTLQRLRET